MITRRIAILGTAAALAACSTDAQDTQARVLADIKGLIPVTISIIAAITAQAPKAIPSTAVAEINALLASAQTAITDFASNPAASMTTIESYLNAALGAIGSALPGAAAAFPVLAMYIPMYQAAASLVELVIEPYLNTLIPTASMRMYATPKYTPDQARAILKIK